VSVAAELPTGWTATTLGEIGAYHNGRGFKKAEWSQTGRPIIRIQNLTDPSKSFNYYEGDDVDPRHEVHPGDLLVSWAATLDVFRWAGSEAVLNQHIFKVESYIDPDFHYYVLTHALAALRAQSHGSGMVHVTRRRFDATPVMLPPREEQRRIAAQLDLQLSRVESGGASLGRALARLDGYRAATLRAVLAGAMVTADPELVRELRNAPHVRLDTVANIRYGHTATAENERVGPRMLRITDIQNGRVDWSRVPCCEASPEERARYRLRAGDIVFARLGFTTGKSYLIGPDVPVDVVYASYLIRVRPTDQVLSEFLGLFFQGAEYWTYIYSQRRGIDRPALNGKILGGLRVPVPSPDAQAAVVRHAHRHLRAVEEMRAMFVTQLNQAKSLKRSLLHVAMSGQLTSTPPAGGGR
jgi:type I restriction enzyme S subunit